MARVELGEYKVQGVDYYYTLQGWIKGVNLQGDHDAEATNNVQKYVSKDAFNYALHYYQDDYQSITGNFGWTAYEYTDLYNGNIASMRTVLKTAGIADMVYEYDQLNRIKSAYNQDRGYGCQYSYDANGNILFLQRNNANDITIDKINYTYNTTQNNRLNSVNDAGNNEGLESGIHSYTYDDIGNLTSDKDIETINWTVYGKIESVLKRDGTEIDYKYDGTGQRIYKKVATTTVTKETHYVRDGSGNVLAIYENEVLDELVIYGSSRLGSYNGKTDQRKRTLGNKKYELSNHLGNVLSVISDNKIGIDSNADLVADTYEPLVISESDYYPFGMAMKERSFSNEEYRFGFNGMEKDTDLAEGKTDFGNRIYSAELGRWWSVDPYANRHPMKSSYQAFNNNPIFFIDPDGGDERVSIDEESHTITISSTIHIYGEYSGDWAKMVEQQWQSLQAPTTVKLPNGDYIVSGNYTDEDGITWTVNLDINFKQVPEELSIKLVEAEQKIVQEAAKIDSPSQRARYINNFVDKLKETESETLKAMGFRDGDNLVGIRDYYSTFLSLFRNDRAEKRMPGYGEGEAKGTKALTLSNLIMMKPESGTKSVAHEVFHSLGFDERYIPVFGGNIPFIGFENDILAAPAGSEINSDHFVLLAKMAIGIWLDNGKVSFSDLATFIKVDNTEAYKAMEKEAREGKNSSKQKSTTNEDKDDDN